MERALALGWRRLLTADGMLIVAFVVIFLFFSVASPVFFTPANLENIGRQTALVTIVAVGMTFVIVAGEFDLSVGSTLALAGVVSALAMKEIAPSAFVGAVVALSTGALIGLINGMLTVGFRIPSFLATLGTLSIARGIVLLLTDTRPVVITNTRYFRFFGEGYLLGAPTPIVWTLVVIAAGIFVLHFSSFGRAVYAAGGNRVAALYSGIRVERVKVLVLVLAGTLAGLAGLVLSARSHAARPDVGAGFELDAITAVILGGAALSGGRGTIPGAVIGSLIIGMLNNGLVLIGIDPSLQIVIKGLIIWLAVTASRL